MDQIALLHTLVNTPTSGAALAQTFGVSRSMVWKGIEALRAEGLDIRAAREGYRVDGLSQAFGAATLGWRCGRPVHYHAEIASTNAEARRLGREGARGALVVADHQTDGRGRRGRSWESPPGQNLMFSLLLHPPIPPQHAPRCVLLWAAAMAEVLDVHLKWPNDLVSADGRKLGGVLAELEAVGDEVHFVVLGVGININQADFDPALPQAVSLRQLTGAAHDRASLLARIVAAIEAVDVTADLGAWRRRARTLGRRVRVAGVEGTAEDIREDGALIVSGKPVLAGDVELVG